MGADLLTTSQKLAYKTYYRLCQEGLFNMLNNKIDFETTTMLDLFGGTGNHSYEFISRGCDDVTYVDKFPGCIAFVTKTAKDLKMKDKSTSSKSDVCLSFCNTMSDSSTIYLLGTISATQFKYHS